MGDFTDRSNDISNGMRLIGAIFIVLHLCFLITLIIVMNGFTNMIDDVTHTPCTDPTTLMFFNYVYAGIYSAYKKNWVCLIVVSVMGISEIVCSTILLVMAWWVTKGQIKDDYRLSYITDSDAEGSVVNKGH